MNHSRKLKLRSPLGGSAKTETVPEKPSSGPVPRIKLQKVAEAFLRWIVVAVFFILIIGGLGARSQSQRTASQLADELTELQTERDKLSNELTQFSDEDWREKFWKWRTMSRSPGEYYIDFVEPEEE